MKYEGKMTKRKSISSANIIYQINALINKHLSDANKMTKKKSIRSQLLGGVGDGSSSRLALLAKQESMEVFRESTLGHHGGVEELVELLVAG